MKKILLASLLAFSFSHSTFSQLETLGLLLNSGDVSEGYTLFNPGGNNDAYLIDNCGQQINKWTFTERPGLTSYLLEDGTHLHAGTDSLEIRDWNNNLLWSFETGTIGFNQHHDIEPLPNGNILLVYADNYTPEEAIASGKDSISLLPVTQFQLDKIIEIQPLGPSEALVVWEWKFNDHFIQDFDATKPNFGVVEDHPELLNINFDGESIQDFTHVNAVDYNSDLDQIIVSARHLSEIYIIDHSTTTAEAASHSGGIYGKGGDFLWRWGNPEVYGAGTAADKKLGKQHDSKWIDGGIHKGKISVFNNDGFGVVSGSSVHVIEPVESNGVYAMSGGTFEPSGFLWSWGGSVQGELMEGSFKCGTQILPNGNALITETSKGKLSEITPTGDVVWVYEIPVGFNSFNQFDDPTGNGSFRVHRYPVDFPGFDGISLTPNGTIEDQNAITDTCVLHANIKDLAIELSIFPNPVKDQLTINVQGEITSIQIFNTVGQLVLTSSEHLLNVETLTAGIYLISVATNQGEAIQYFVKE
jgi:hypothetical protein